MSAFPLSLLEAAALLFPKSSKNTLRSWIREGRLSVRGAIVTHPAFPVSDTRHIALGSKRKIIRSDLPILYEDEDFVVVEKPSGLLSVAAPFEKRETVHALLKNHYHRRRVYVVHRLDQDASGVLLFAFSEPFYERIKELFSTHALERAYTAMVEGCFLPKQGAWRSYQYEDGAYRVHDTTDPAQGRLAITHYRQLSSHKHYSRLELKLETGRKNQIRVHCQSAGHPIAGDKKYGALTNPLKRLCLHAHLLAFQHPFTKKYLTFTSPVPEAFSQADGKS